MTETIAMVFPGQGSQSLGMLSPFVEKYPLIKNTFFRASEVLGYDLLNLINEGPIEKLNQTEFTQPALLTASVALWRLWQSQHKPTPSFLLGHSLGEYSALVCAESLTFEEGLQLVSLRGKLMQEAIPKDEGAMAAILGLEDTVVQEICSSVQKEGEEKIEKKEKEGFKKEEEREKEGFKKESVEKRIKQIVEIVEPANYNCPGQVVISGHIGAVLRAIEICKEKGAKRAIQLPVSIPSHCSIMKPASVLFAEALEKIDFKLPVIPIIHNVDTLEHRAPKDIRKALVEQLYQPVRWVESIQKIAALGVHTVLECGPSNVLTGLNKRIDKTLSCHTLSEQGEIYAFN